MKTKRICPACGNNDGEAIYTIKMAIPPEIKLDDEYDIVSCNRCGCCYADTGATAEAYNDYYSNHNYYSGGLQCNGTNRYDANVICRILSQYITKDDTILDIGCGNGKLLAYIKNTGFSNVYGVDPSRESVGNLKKMGIDGAVGSIYEKPVEEIKKGKAVIFTMVLEHLLEPDKAIKNIKDYYLEKDGIVIVTWPHFEDLISDGTPVLNNFNHEHINYFSQKTADVLFDRCGFDNLQHHISTSVIIGDDIQYSNISVYQIVNENKKCEYIKDNKTKSSIIEYVNRSVKNENEMINSINDAAKNHEDVIVWGTGSFFMHLMKVSDLSKCNIISIVDNNELKHGQKYNGYTISSPESLKGFTGTIIIAVMLWGKMIREQIIDMGLLDCNIISIS